MASLSDVAVAQALVDLQQGRFTSRRACARAYGISEITLRRREQNPSSTRTNAAIPKRSVTPWQEELLSAWILNSEQCGHAVTFTQLREFVTLLNRSSGGTDCGHNWVGRFLARRPDLRSKIGKKIDTLRIQNTNPELLKLWFESLCSLMQRISVHHSNIWNMDETGIALGVCSNQRVIGSSSTTQTYIRTPENREWVSILECISAIGQKIAPVVIFKGKSLQTSWFTPGKTPEYLYTTSENGWTSNTISLQWLKEVFLPFTQCNNAPHLLLLDNHGSHISVEFMKICWQHNVYLYYLIPHSSHVLQPLDLSCFSPLKSRYRQDIAALATLSDSAPIKKARFLEYYNKARNEGLTEYNIRAGWKAAGIIPWDPQKVIRSSQVKTLTGSLPIPTPSTPQTARTYTTITTPQNYRDLALQFQQIVNNEKVSRSIRTLVRKASKTMEIYTFKNVEQTRLINTQSSQIEHLSNKRKKKVTVDSNMQFANIASIIRAQAEVEQRKAKYEAQDRAKIAREVAADVLRRDITAFLHEFHVADDVGVATATSTL